MGKAQFPPRLAENCAFLIGIRVKCRYNLFSLQDILAEAGEHGGRFCTGRGAFRSDAVAGTSVDDSMPHCPGNTFRSPATDSGLIDEWGKISACGVILVSIV